MSRVFWDTNIFIYELEGNLRYSGAASKVFSWTAQASTSPRASNTTQPTGGLGAVAPANASAASMPRRKASAIVETAIAESEAAGPV